MRQIVPRVSPLAFVLVDGVAEKLVSLKLPAVLVDGSAMASVSVLGEFNNCVFIFHTNKKRS